MNRKDFLRIIILMVLSTALYYPVFFTEYLYTDEAVQLWLYRKGSDFHMFTFQGRYLTDQLFLLLFGKANTIHDLIFIRVFAFCGWVVSIPIWYTVIKKIVQKENLADWIPFISVLYLICTPVFSISIGWASCMELFIANTTGLLSGYILYSGIRYKEGKIRMPFTFVVGAAIFGIVSLFTYQNGFGSFLLPFLLHFLANPGKWKKLLIGIAGYLVICIVYYALFKYQIKVSGVTQLARTNLHINPVNKIKFFFTKPLVSSFHFNYLVTETSRSGVIVSWVLFAISLAFYYFRLNLFAPLNRIKQILLLVALLMLTYLPSLLVKENYSSNRTLLALMMCVFVFVIYTFLGQVKSFKIKAYAMVAISAILLANAYYNFRYQFLNPVKREYDLVRKAVEETYKPGIDSFLVIQPGEDFSEKKYGVTRSWDEFGVSSFFFNWVPEFFVRQVVFEKTQNRELANKLVIKNWIGEEEFKKTGISAGENAVLIDTEQILR